MIVEIVGYTAAVIGTCLMLPQVIKTIQTKSMNDVSPYMLVLYFINSFLWLVYGILITAWPVIICNFIALIISILLLILNVHYRR